MTEILDEDLDESARNVLDSISGISQLYPVQQQLLALLVKQENIFFTSGNDSTKILEFFEFSKESPKAKSFLCNINIV